MVQTIDPASAKSLIKEFQDQNSASGGTGLITPSNEFLKGFFIDRETLEHILHHHHDVKGLSIYFAKHPDYTGIAGDKHFTLVFYGSKTNTHNGAEPYERQGDIYCAPPPCPPICADLGHHH